MIRCLMSFKGFERVKHKCFGNQKHASMLPLITSFHNAQHITHIVLRTHLRNCKQYDMASIVSFLDNPT